MKGFIPFNKEEFTQAISKGFSLVDISAEWCGPCHLMEKVLVELEPELKDLQIIQINVDDEEDTVVEDYGILKIPTLLLFRDGALVNQLTGAQTKQNIQTWLQENL